jgi:serine/threonine protein kinase
MEYVEGTTLGDLMERGRLPFDTAVRYAVAIAQGLEAAHGAGVFHRGLKPSNIMITASGQVKLLDFGLAKVVPLSAEDGTATLPMLTEPGVAMGTVAWMSPEQAQGSTVDHRSDIFSFGVVLYEMLSGVRPFRGSNAVSVPIADFDARARAADARGRKLRCLAVLAERPGEALPKCDGPSRGAARSS